MKPARFALGRISVTDYKIKDRSDLVKAGDELYKCLNSHLSPEAE